MVQKWSKRRSRGGPRFILPCCKSILGLGWGDSVVPKVVQERYKSGAKVVQKWSKNDEKRAQKWSKSGTKVVEKVVNGVVQK